MNDQEVVADIMKKIAIMQEYKDKYGEDDTTKVLIIQDKIKNWYAVIKEKAN